MATADLSRINSNIGALNALNSLKNIQSEMALRQLRLATGVRINTAADDPAGFRISVKLNARSRGLSQALDNIGDAKNMLSTAETGLSKIKDLLLTIRDKLVAGANDTLGSEERLAIAQQVKEYMHEIVRLAHETRWNDLGLLDDSDPTQDSFYFQTGADSYERTEWKKSFAIAYDETKVEISKEGSVASYSVYDSTTGHVDTQASFSESDVDSALTASTGVSDAVNDLIKKVDASIRGVSEWIAGIGALSARLETKEKAVAAMQVNVEASFNRIYNADMAYEQLQLTKAQILQQTATAMLAQANTAPQQILALFR